MAGRLTFNPLSHLDLFGTLALVLTRMIGWAKPVPVDPRYLKRPLRDMLWISLGGPVANIIVAIVLGTAVETDRFGSNGGIRLSHKRFLHGTVISHH